MSDLAPAAWSAFVDGHPDASIFHTPEMCAVFEHTRDYEPSAWGAVDADGQVHALMTPVTISLLKWPLRGLSSRDVAFAGPLVEPGPQGDRALRELVRGYQRRRSRLPVATEIRNLNADDHLWEVLAGLDVRREAHLNFLVDLQAPEEDLWGRIASSARRNVRKARRLGVTITQAKDPAEIEDAYEVLRQVYKRIEVPLPDRTLFQGAARILGPLDRFRILLARREGQVIGVLTLLLFNGVVTYWYTGTLREQWSCGAGDLLVWHAISTAHREGYRRFDFGGAGRPWEPYGVRDFKAKYGGELVDLGRGYWEPATVRLRVATIGYRLIRRFL